MKRKLAPKYMVTQSKSKFDSDPFFCYRRILPEEYNWVAEFHNLALRVYRTAEVIVPLDVGKVLGLATYARELEKAIHQASKTGDK